MSTGPVVANKKIPTVLGWINIVVGGLWVGVLLLSILSLIAAPSIQKSTGGVMQYVQAMIDGERKKDEQRLEAELKSATTDAQKDAITSRLQRLRAVKPPDMMKVMNQATAMQKDPRIIGYSVIDIATGIPLAGLVLASGIGLVKLRPWGRKVGYWTASVCLPRAIMIGVFYIVVMAPLITKMQTDMVNEMFSSMPGGKPPAMPFSFEKMYTITNTLTGVGMIVIGSALPLVEILLLRKRSVQAACGELATGFATPPPAPAQPAAPRDPFAPLPGFPTEPPRS